MAGKLWLYFLLQLLIPSFVAFISYKAVSQLTFLTPSLWGLELGFRWYVICFVLFSLVSLGWGNLRVQDVALLISLWTVFGSVLVFVLTMFFVLVKGAFFVGN